MYEIVDTVDVHDYVSWLLDEAVHSVSVHDYYSFSTLLHCVKLSDNKQII